MSTNQDIQKVLNEFNDSNLGQMTDETIDMLNNLHEVARAALSELDRNGIIAGVLLKHDNVREWWENNK